MTMYKYMYTVNKQVIEPYWWKYVKGWEQYFEELSTFIYSLSRGRMTYANEGYTEYGAWPF